jgi:peptidyl-prolyl cis-trans isomerase SurA
MTFRSTILGVLALGLGATTLPVLAQNEGGSSASEESAAQGPSNGLNIPADVQLFGSADPNVRKPTAVVNGQIITVPTSSSGWR